MIITDILNYKNAKNTFRSINIKFNYSNDNIYNICENNPEYIITLSDVSHVTKKYPHIKFIYPNGSFPNYKLVPMSGFNSLELLDFEDGRISNVKCCFINSSHQNKIFAQKIKSMYSCHIYGIGFGINEINKSFKNTSSIYNKYEICATTSQEESFKALALGKHCVTNFNFPYCDNIFNNEKYEFSKTQIDYAMNNTFYDVFYHIFKHINQEISEKLKDKKEIVHATSIFAEC